MKKMFFGGILFISGFIGVLALTCISVFKPWDYNGTTGITGFLLGTDTMNVFILCSALVVIGFVVCAIEAFKKD